MAAGMRAATIKGTCGVAELEVKGESVAVGMRAATFKRVRGAPGIMAEVARPVIKCEFMAVGTRAVTTKGR